MFCNLLAQNDSKLYQNSTADHTDSIDVQKSYEDSLDSVLAKIGTFWPFLTTFGIESVTRLPIMFFRLFISHEITYGSLNC